jgi:hypothetical protein
MYTPLALELHRRCEAGESVEKLSSEFGIPVGRIEHRLRAAAAYLARRTAKVPGAPSAGTIRVLTARAGSEVAREPN